MFGRGIRILLNALSIIGIAWIGYVVYGSFTSTGIWRVVEHATTSDTGRTSPAGTFAICALAGVVPLIALGWVVWRLFLRDREG